MSPWVSGGAARDRCWIDTGSGAPRAASRATGVRWRRLGRTGARTSRSDTGATTAMVHLRLSGVTEDGRTLRLVSDAGVEFTVDVDDRLRAALSGEGGDQARLGQLETRMESTLRPPDIQARVRSGETPESVAQVAGTSVDKVMPYAAPVLAEREHVAQRAQRASIRRRPVEGGAVSSARTLGDAVGSHLRSRNVDPDTVAWDAWRREDGRWTLTGSYATTE